MKLLHGDSLEVLKGFPENSIDACVTDPPAGISFMSKSWDDDKGGRDQWIEWLASVMREVNRVLKPGAHALVWAIPRTAHWTGFALEDAGFEVRDCITHLFGSGFPKSMNVSIAIDKQKGLMGSRGKAFVTAGRGDRADIQDQNGKEMPVHDGISPEAKQWQGWGTALKPASEFWWLIRKPLSEDTVAKNVLRWGTGALNIDGCRIESKSNEHHRSFVAKAGKNKNTYEGQAYANAFQPTNATGRFPANLILSHSEYCTDEQCDIECITSQLDGQSGVSKSSKSAKTDKRLVQKAGNSLQLGKAGVHSPENSYLDSGGCSRFFFQARPDEICYVCDELCSAQSVQKNLKNPTENNSYAADHVAVSGQQTSVGRLVSSGIHAFNATSPLLSGQATTEVSAQETVQTNLDELKGLIAKSAGHLCEKCITYTAQKLVAIKLGQTPELIAGPVSTIDYRKNILTQSLVSFAEPWANTGTIPTIQSLSILFGYVQAAIRKNTIREKQQNEKELGPTRFKYNSKVSSRERNQGCEGLKERAASVGDTRPSGSMNERIHGKENRSEVYAKNNHPTVKPIRLMAYLCRLITPPNGTILDPFMGSGSTGMAAIQEGFDFIGIEREKEYFEIAEKRIASCLSDSHGLSFVNTNEVSHGV